jgi:hypothetical protein
MLTPSEAERLIRENIPLLHREDCPLAAAHGRVLRADLRADRDLPPFDRVTMDGYAVRAAALAGASRAGLQPAECDAVFTQHPAAFDHAPASGLQRRVDMLGTGFGFVHGESDSEGAAIKTRSRNFWGTESFQAVDFPEFRFRPASR